MSVSTHPLVLVPIISEAIDLRLTVSFIHCVADDEVQRKEIAKSKYYRSFTSRLF